jgi:hypothetical protein
MPVRWDFGSIHAPDTDNKRSAIRSWVTGNRRKLAPFYNRRPLQVSSAHDVVSGPSRSFVLAERSGTRHCRAREQRAGVGQTILFHEFLSVRKQP